MCFDQLVCEEECCHDLDFGVPYCCSKYTGFIYLGLMVGGGVIIAVLIIACYVFMRRTERELEAAAKLEAAKAANSLVHGTGSDSPTAETDERHQVPDLNLPPPSYQDVVRNFSRCHSCDVSMARPVDIVSSLVRQYSQGSQAPLRGLPVLVDVQELIARHRREHAMEEHLLGSGLPPLVSQEALDNKLPSYEDCTNRDECTSREQGAGSQTGSGSHKHASDVLCRIGCCHDHGINIETQSRRHKLVGETNTYFDDVIEGVAFPSRGTGAAAEVRDLCDAPQPRSEVKDLCDAPQPRSEVKDLCDAPQPRSEVKDLCDAPQPRSEVKDLCDAPQPRSEVKDLCDAPQPRSEVKDLCDAPQLRSEVKDLGDAPQLRSEVKDLGDAPQLQAGAFSPISEDVYSTHKPREIARGGIRTRDETATTFSDEITMTCGQTTTVVDLSIEAANKTATTVVDLSIEAANKTATTVVDLSIEAANKTATTVVDLSIEAANKTATTVVDLSTEAANKTATTVVDLSIKAANKTATTVVDLSIEAANKTATTVVDLSIEAANTTATYDNAFPVQTVQRTATSTSDVSVRSVGTTTKVVTDLLGSDRNQTCDRAGDLSSDQAGDLSGDQAGDLSGDQAGDLSGDHAGDREGDQAGDREGDREGDPIGNLVTDCDSAHHAGFNGNI